ncbi:MAG: serine/threonine protein kinase [Xanthomonadales bacterium]|nr:serine/threonine protein kinase [Xanthomonadales bacterium]MBP6078620.1 serine/threonine protein kinase [Xanthomonadales bacterium]MBP7622789.1 serine/threonine protein kinase [Xanthomonadales bacterium]
MNATPFAALSPDFVLDAIEALGFDPDGRLQALNSFENRVYQVGIEGGEPLIAKFYRPGRWSDAAIREEHAYANELVEAELPVVAPLVIDGDTLFDCDGQRVALFPRKGGRAPELEGLDVAQWLGRLIARIHSVGARRPFAARGRIDVASRVDAAAAHVLDAHLLPPQLVDRYERLVDAVATRLDDQFAVVQPALLRLHGDCHPGNLLWTDAGPHFVDLDDAAMGPAIQDLWMLMDGGAAQGAALLEGYAEFRDLDPGELSLVEPLRIMRQIHHAGWISARYDDPAFPRAFPFAAEPRWWEEHCDDLMRWLESD